MGFPESELTVLFGFFRTAWSTSVRNQGNRKHEPGPGKLRAIPPGSTSAKEGAASGGDTHGADWTVAVACLRLLARPKESVLSAILGVFEVFARARGGRIRHRKRLERERKGKEKEKELEEERERWKRRRRREKALGATHKDVSYQYIIFP